MFAKLADNGLGMVFAEGHGKLFMWVLIMAHRRLPEAYVSKTSRWKLDARPRQLVSNVMRETLGKCQVAL